MQQNQLVENLIELVHHISETNRININQQFQRTYRTTPHEEFIPNQGFRESTNIFISNVDDLPFYRRNFI